MRLWRVPSNRNAAADAQPTWKVEYRAVNGQLNAMFPESGGR